MGFEGRVKMESGIKGCINITVRGASYDPMGGRRKKQKERGKGNSGKMSLSLTE